MTDSGVCQDSESNPRSEGDFSSAKSVCDITRPPLTPVSGSELLLAGIVLFHCGPDMPKRPPPPHSQNSYSI